MKSPCPTSVGADHARGLVLEHGWNTTCYQILNPGITLWFSTSRDAVIGYVLCGRNRVVAGAPVCPMKRLSEVLDEWHRDADRACHGVCYFGAEERLRDALADRTGFQTVSLGAQPVWTPESFIDAFAEEKSLRYQLSRAKNKQVRINEWESHRAAGNVELRTILDQWLATRGLPPMHFMVEPYTLDCLADRRLFVATIQEKPVGFAVLTPVPDRRGWLTEQFVRGSEAPNGTVELLLEKAVSAVCDSSSSFVTMGIVPLSSHGWDAEEQNPQWLQLAMRWFRAHGRRFYNFDGLDTFKSKFNPDFWEPIYAISHEKRFSFSTLYSIAEAFCQSSPLLALSEGLGRAVKQEWRWVMQGR